MVVEVMMMMRLMKGVNEDKVSVQSKSRGFKKHKKSTRTCTLSQVHDTRDPLRILHNPTEKEDKTQPGMSAIVQINF